MTNGKLITAAFLLLFSSAISAQTQLAINKNPDWNFTQTYDASFAVKTDLPNNTTAMLVNIPKADFGVACVTNRLTTAWITPLGGFPLSIGRLKGKILVIAASDRSFFKSVSNSLKGYLLDEKTGKVLLEKEIFKGSEEYMQQADFFHAEDGSYFKITTRTSNVKRKVHIALPGPLGLLSILKGREDFRTTRSFTVTDYDDQLNAIYTTDPEIPAGNTFNYTCTGDGNFIASSYNEAKSQCSVSIYTPGNPKPTKTISFPVYLKIGTYPQSVKFAISHQPLKNYIALTYKNVSKETALTVASLNFADGTVKTSTEVFNKQHLKEMDKGFVPLNKKFDDLKLDGNIAIDHILEHNGNVLVGLSTTTAYSLQGAIITDDNAVILNFYDKDLKQLSQQFIPRHFQSQTGQGAAVAYNGSGNKINIIANHKDSGIQAMFAQMDAVSGKITNILLLPKDDLKRNYYVNTEAVSWLGNNILLSYFERKGAFSQNVDIQYQLLGF